MKKQMIMGVGITDATEEEISKYIFKGLKEKGEKLIIITPNPEILVYATKHPEYKLKLNKADVALPDGVGVFLAGLLVGKPFKERIPGVDFIEELCRNSAKNPVSMGFLGGRGGVAKRTAERLQEKYPWIDVVFIGEDWFDKDKNTHYGAKKTIDILFVAFGFPKQEEWIFDHLEDLPVKAAMGVGGSFDYISGDVVRAPFIIRAMGLEWLFRLVRQPWRIKRQLALVEFMFLIVKEVVKSSL